MCGTGAGSGAHKQHTAAVVAWVRMHGRCKGLNVGATLYEVATTIGLLDRNAVPFALLVHKRATEVSRTPNPEYLWYHSVLAEMGRPESLGSPSLKRDVADMVAKMKRAAHSRTHVASAREKKRKHTLQALN